jgi:hypothetical protein
MNTDSVRIERLILDLNKILCICIMPIANTEDTLFRENGFIITDNSGITQVRNSPDALMSFFMAPPQFPNTVWNCIANGWGMICSEGVIRQNFVLDTQGASLPYNSGGRCIMKQDDGGILRYSCAARNDIIRGSFGSSAPARRR